MDTGARVKYELDPTETRAADHYRQDQIDNKGSKKDRVYGPSEDRRSDYSGTI
jgi:hypothetical protein